MPFLTRIFSEPLTPILTALILPARVIGQLIFPKRCLGCRDTFMGLSHETGDIAIDNQLCQECAQAVAADFSSTFLAINGGRGGMKLQFPVVYIEDSTRAIRSIITGLKDEQCFSSLPILRVMANRVSEYFFWSREVSESSELGSPYRQHPAETVMLPVPSRAGAKRDRGFSLVELAFKSWLDLQIAGQVWLVKASGDQRQLGASQRQRNLAGAFYVNPKAVAGKNIILLDDVLTSGATMQSLAQAVHDAGGTILAGLALARTPKRFGN